MSSRRARRRHTADVESRHSNHPAPHPAPPENPPSENPPRDEADISDATPRTGTEGNNSGANVSGGGTTEAGAGAMWAAVLEALSDPAVVRQLAADVSNSSASSTSASTSAHKGKIGTVVVFSFVRLRCTGCDPFGKYFRHFSLILQGRPH